MANVGSRSEAREHFDLVLSGKPLEVNHTRKGKYSLEVCPSYIIASVTNILLQTSLIMRTSAAVDALDKDKKM